MNRLICLFLFAPALLVATFMVGCMSGGIDRPYNRYDFEPGPIARKYLNVSVVKPPKVLSRRAWSDQAPRGKYRSQRAPSRILVFGEPDYRLDVEDPVAYLADKEAKAWKEHSWGDIPFHYYIADPEIIFAGRDERLQAVSDRENLDLEDTIVVSFLGVFEERPPKPRTMDIFADLLTYLVAKHRIDSASIVRADKIASDLPGPGKYVDYYFDSGWIERAVEERMTLAHTGKRK